MENYITEFEKKITDISKNAQNIYIVNAGVMNHGKSSLFNSILNREEFKTQDIRTTVQNQTAKWKENVYLIDTPGIEAKTKDDEEAYKEYKNANMIVFVHTLRIGELHKNEVDAINKMKSIFENENYFWNHFCIVLTFLESIFLVSNDWYKQGENEKEEIFIQDSGILEFREYLEKNIEKWQKENKEVKNSIIDREKKELVNKIDEIYSEKIEKIKEQQKEFSKNFKRTIDEYISDNSEINVKQERANILKKEIDDLKIAHQKEKSKY